MVGFQIARDILARQSVWLALFGMVGFPCFGCLVSLALTVLVISVWAVYFAPLGISALPALVVWSASVWTV